MRFMVAEGWGCSSLAEGLLPLGIARPWVIPSTLRGKKCNWKCWWESLMTWCQVLSFLLNDVRTGSLDLRDSRRAERLLSKHIWVYISSTYAVLALRRQGQADHWALWPTNWKISSVSELQVQWEILSPKMRWRVTEEDTHIDLFPPHTAVCSQTTLTCAHTKYRHTFFNYFSPLIFVTTELNSPVLVPHYSVLSSGDLYVLIWYLWFQVDAVWLLHNNLYKWANVSL